MDASKKRNRDPDQPKIKSFFKPRPIQEEYDSENIFNFGQTAPPKLKRPKKDVEKPVDNRDPDQPKIKSFFKPRPIQEEYDSENIFNFGQTAPPKLKRPKKEDDKPIVILSDDDDDKPIYSHEHTVQGICSFEGCRTKTIQKKGFCQLHWNDVIKMRTKIAKELSIKCPESREDCPRILGYAQQKCKHHEYAKIGTKQENDDFEKEMQEVEAAIEIFIKPIAEKGIDFYIGVTYSVELRLNKHLSEYREVIKATSSVENILTTSLMKVIGAKKAARIEQMAISRCVLNVNKAIRSKILNESGGGDLNETNYRHPNTEYTLYVRYDKTGLTNFSGTCRFQDGNLSGEQLEKVFIGIFNMRKLGELIEAGNDICFGITSHKNFISRMGDYNNMPQFEEVSKHSMENQILVATGTKYKISDDETVIPNKNDIRKIEMVAITQLKFGELSKYTENVMNVEGGGETLGQSKEVLYFRIGKKCEKPVIVKETKCVEYYKGEIPKSKNGLIDWSTLVPSWKIVLDCGSKMKKKRETDFVCVCGKMFAQEKGLVRHKLICEAAGGKKTQVACPECGKLVSERYLPDHKKIVHGNKNPSRGSKALAKRGKFVSKEEKDDDDFDEQEKDDDDFDEEYKIKDMMQ